MKKVYIGVDVGGMSIKAGAVDLNGKILLKDKVVTDGKHVDVFLKDIKELLVKIINECKEKELDVQGIGFGVPGMVDNKKGLINKMANIGGRDVPLKDYLKDLNLPIYLSNDANVAALGEQRFGVAKGMQNVVLLTLGTGIGGGLILNGKLYEGNEGKGAELGHVCLILNGRSCGCGRKGCFEKYASMKVFKNNLRKELNLDEKTSGKDLLNIIRESSKNKESKKYKVIEKVIDKYINYLALGLANLINIFEPEAIGIGGSFVYFEEELLGRLKEKLLEKNMLFNPRENIVIETAILGNDAGIIGSTI